MCFLNKPIFGVIILIILISFLRKWVYVVLKVRFTYTNLFSLFHKKRVGICSSTLLSF